MCFSLADYGACRSCALKVSFKASRGSSTSRVPFPPRHVESPTGLENFLLGDCALRTETGATELTVVDTAIGLNIRVNWPKP